MCKYEYYGLIKYNISKKKYPRYRTCLPFHLYELLNKAPKPT